MQCFTLVAIPYQREVQEGGFYGMNILKYYTEKYTNDSWFHQGKISTCILSFCWFYFYLIFCGKGGIKSHLTVSCEMEQSNSIIIYKNPILYNEVQMDKTKYFNVWRAKIFVYFKGHLRKKSHPLESELFSYRSSKAN